MTNLEGMMGKLILPINICSIIIWGSIRYFQKEMPLNLYLILMAIIGMGFLIIEEIKRSK